jgi:predicted nucleic acid-binding protein
LILADSSIWVDHFRSRNPNLVALAWQEVLCCHPAVIGELACGHIADREKNLALMKGLRRAPIAEDEDVLHLIETHNLMGRGVGYIDMQLLASAKMLPGLIWTRDRRLREAAQSLGVSY